ncbi:type I-E CRISPR-associated protein Cse1/CasA [Thiocapsa imhoffii]|uniref:Type I-E CRISPR-associated protein Cse1/CasA n=1 Tax=Thiocapsa imhoffii TaxID=382777 RepID=A0A9X0WFY5_9GAMM|nr:type I-E CRISPR-associated protein Cse1/CasA [Thiocapsa imhoffii]MBK1643780.1 type I-E CRISPR-associated protein Cse1/CasA [Thiocapsa imhoffii]
MTRTTEPAFNLLDEPWIPVRMLHGETLDISLSQALLEADRFSALAETSPPNLIALYRLLLTILHRALSSHHGAWTDAVRARWYREGLPEAPICAYLNEWRERFWLFHPEHPFMQVAALADVPEIRDKQKPWTQICLECANGNTPLVFDHALDDLPAEIMPSLACRHLLGALQFTPGGLVKVVRDSDKAGPLANTAAVMPIGKTLTSTLLSGLHPYRARGQDDRPSWEQSRPNIESLKAPPRLVTGPNDRYTRLTRAVLLARAGADRGIRHILFAAGLALEEDAHAPDPMACYRFNKDGKAIRVSFTEGRALWRELPALVPDATGKFNQPATILSGAANLFEQMGKFDEPIPVLIAGLASDQAKLLRWRIERFDLPLTVLANPEAAADLRARVRQAEDTYFRLRAICVEMVTDTMPDPSHKDTKARARSILDNGPTAPVFFSTTERGLPVLIQRIAAGDSDGAHQHWLEQLQAATRRAWTATCRALGETPRALRAMARADPGLHRLVRSLDPSAITSEETIP